MRDLEAKKNQILDRVGIVDLIGEHVTLRRSGRRFLGLCPFHTEKTPSFTVNPELGIFKCFGCGKGGDIFTFLQEHEAVSFMEAMQILADRTGIELRSERSPDQAQSTTSRAEVVAVNTWAVKFFRSTLVDNLVGASTREYLAHRNISEQTTVQFALGLASVSGKSLQDAAREAGYDTKMLIEADLLRMGDSGSPYPTFRDRLMFPIRDAMGRVIGFGGRTLIDDRAKYLNTRQNLVFDKGRGLYGIDLARRRMADIGRAILVEGYTDCLAAHQAGFGETIATLGTALTEAQVDLIRRYCEDLVLLFDSDDAGVAAADRAIRIAMPRYLNVKLARIPDGKDPADFLANHPPADFEDLLKDAIDALEFKWNVVRQSFRNDSSDRNRKNAVLDFTALVAETASMGAMDPIQRGLIANRIASLVGAEPREIHNLLTKTRPRRVTAQASVSADAVQTTSTKPHDGIQAAWADLIGTLLIEPGLLSEIGNWPDLETIAGTLDRKIAEEVIDLFEEFGEFKLHEVFARFRDPADIRRIAELAERAQLRGNTSATVNVALHRIRQGDSAKAEDSARERLNDDSAQDDRDVRDDALRTIHGSLKELRHFAPRRMLRRRQA